MWVLLLGCFYSAYHFTYVEQQLRLTLGWSPNLSVYMWSVGIVASFGMCVLIPIRQLFVIRSLLCTIDGDARAETTGLKVSRSLGELEHTLSDQ